MLLTLKVDLQDRVQVGLLWEGVRTIDNGLVELGCKKKSNAYWSSQHRPACFATQYQADLSAIMTGVRCCFDTYITLAISALLEDSSSPHPHLTP